MKASRMFLWAVLLMAPLAVFSHSGGLDGNGGHTDSKTGRYHVHRAPAQGQPSSGGAGSSAGVLQSAASAPAQLGPQCSEAEADRRVQEYFRSANEGLAGKPIGEVFEPNVHEETKAFVLARDGHCVVCGSTMKLEVDHKVALENGGSNSVSNLATLCDACHTKKTRMDNALRRHREALAKK